MRNFMQAEGDMCLNFMHAQHTAPRSQAALTGLSSYINRRRSYGLLPVQILQCLTPAANRCYFQPRQLFLPRADNFRRSLVPSDLSRWQR